MLEYMPIFVLELLTGIGFMSNTIETLIKDIPKELKSEDSVWKALDLVENASPPDPDTVQDAIPEKGLTVGLHMLLAASLRDSGNEAEADKVAFAVVERLNQSGYYKAMARVLTPLLGKHGSHAAPLLLRARLQGGSEAVGDDVLLQAHRAMPKHGVLSWQASQVFQAQGDDKSALGTAAKALPSLVEDKNFEAADEVALFLGERETQQTAWALLESMKILARQDAWERFDSYLELGMPLFQTEAGAEAWPVLRDQWLKHPDPEGLRPHLVEVLRASLTRFPDPEAIVRTSRINIPSEEPQACLKRLKLVLTFAPGNYAQHKSWGIGPIRENDTEAIIIDFPQKPGHRMTLTTAERALDVYSPDDLLVLQAYNPDELKRILKEQPEEVIVRVLRRIPGGEGTLDQIRKILVPAVMASQSWAAWWKRVKPKLGSHPMIDSRRAFENVFRLRGPGETADELQLPSWNPRQDSLKNLQLLDTFLEQHPGESSRVAEAFGDQVQRINTDASLDGGSRVAAALWLERQGLVPEVPLTALSSVMDFAPLSKPDQMSLVKRIENPEDFAGALNSRLAVIRTTAWDRALSSSLAGEVADAVLHHAERLPDAVVALAEKELPAGLQKSVITKRLMAALLRIAEDPPRATLRKRVLEMFKPGTPLAVLAGSAPVPPDEAGVLTSRLKGWKASDTIRFPLMDFLRQVGHGHVADSVEGHRARAAARLSEKAHADVDPFDGDLVLTRESLDRMENERARIGQELKTTVPQAIQKAREFGDLKENAEYKAAKEKQATYAARFQELETQLRQVRLIESLERPADTAFPGTQITLEPMDGGAAWVVWMLGEGDQDFGDNVVSYKAPVGQVLLGAKVGDVLEFIREGSNQSFQVSKVEERLP